MSILTVAAASGVGKSTFVREFLKTVPGSTLLTSVTSRLPRAGDMEWEGVPEYEYMTPKEIFALDERGEFLELFGEDHPPLYATRAKLFEQALASSRIYLAMLYVPGVELFFDEARSLDRENNVYAVFFDLDSEEERIKRLTMRGEKDQTRFEPQLNKWRRLVEKSDVPFFLMKANEPPSALVEQAIRKFGIAVKA
jgi:guanylate kinase